VGVEGGGGGGGGGGRGGASPPPPNNKAHTSHMPPTPPTHNMTPHHAPVSPIMAVTKIPAMGSSAGRPARAATMPPRAMTEEMASLRWCHALARSTWLLCLSPTEAVTCVCGGAGWPKCKCVPPRREGGGCCDTTWVVVVVVCVWEGSEPVACLHVGPDLLFHTNKKQKQEKHTHAKKTRRPIPYDGRTRTAPGRAAPSRRWRRGRPRQRGETGRRYMRPPARARLPRRRGPPGGRGGRASRARGGRGGRRGG
jgi:hypothetical protein